MDDKVQGIYATEAQDQSLADAIRPYYDTDNGTGNALGVPLAELPKDLRARVSEAFRPLSWDEMGAGQRMRFAQQFDANEPRNDEDEDTLGELLRLRQTIRNMETSQPEATKSEELVEAPVSKAKENLQTEGVNAGTQAVPVAQTEAIDFGMLATPEQLINAFGSFTGMCKAWFNNLTDTPKLLAARRVTGTGGKHHTPPLFCPFEVMQWLIDGKRKKGRKVSPEKAWQLLQSNFEKVYNTRSAGDPR